MSFADIEQVTGVSLPPKAQQHRAWWSNSPSNNVMTKVWVDAGFRSEQVDMASRKLVFRRVRPATPELSLQAPGGMSEAPRGFARDQSPRLPRRHPLFGAMKGAIATEAGHDFADPAMPEWADMLDRDHGPDRWK